MLRLAVIAASVSAYVCSLRAGPALQLFVFDSGDPASIAALLCHLGVGLFVFTLELCAVLFFESVSLLHGHPWLLSVLGLSFVAAVTALMHRLLPA